MLLKIILLFRVGKQSGVFVHSIEKRSHAEVQGTQRKRIPMQKPPLRSLLLSVQKILLRGVEYAAEKGNCIVISLLSNDFL